MVSGDEETMTFTDDDLKRLKDFVAHGDLRVDIPIMKALLARLEAAELTIKIDDQCKCARCAFHEERYQAWHVRCEK